MAAAWPVLRDALLVAAVSVLTVQGLRTWVGDRYLVPSGSMQPVLYGDPDRGDVVFVDKLARARDQRRGDLVVVANERLAGHQLVKRIAARGDDDDACWIDLKNGDVWLGPDAQHMKREVKDPRWVCAHGVPWARAGGAGSGGDAGAPLDLHAASGPGPWSLAPAARSLAELRSRFRPRARRARFRDLDDGVLPAGAIGTRVPVDASYLDLEGVRSGHGGDVPVADCGAHFVFAAAPGAPAGDTAGATAWPDAIVSTIDSSDFATSLVWIPKQNYIEVWLDGRKVREAKDVLDAPWQGRLWFGRLDGHDYLLLDDVGKLVLPVPGTSTLPRPRTWLHLLITGVEDLTCTEFAVHRDIYAWRQPSLSVGSSTTWPRFVEAGHWFLLGDNAFDSEDSRYHGSFPTDLFLGVPRWVLGPWSRARRLP
ncbi:MAG: S26 family signal peptidase [Planctomycetota bacterium]